MLQAAGVEMVQLAHTVSLTVEKHDNPELK